jgi:CheY-like chemotaxis protein
MSWKPTILCVDDTPGILEGWKMLLEENGYRILTATNGKQAVEVFMTNSVDLVLLDYHMPEMDGSTAAAHMKEFKPDVPVMLLSSDAHLPEEVLETADCFMSKSKPLADFLVQVDYLLSLRILFLPLPTLIIAGARDRANLSPLDGAERNDEIANEREQGTVQPKELMGRDRRRSTDPAGLDKAA